jgi:hypothetical protein
MVGIIEISLGNFVPQTPKDLSRWCQSGKGMKKTERQRQENKQPSKKKSLLARLKPSLAPGVALGLRPRIALSSIQVAC